MSSKTVCRCDNCSVKRNQCPALVAGGTDSMTAMRREWVCAENIKQIDTSKPIFD
jgi:hypothetical protein